MGGNEGQQTIVEDAVKRRAMLRQEYIKQISNPHRHATNEGGYLFDPALQRFESMKVTSYDHFRPTPKSSAWGLILIVIPIGLYAWLLKTDRDKKEKMYRTGQVAYRDRRFKFI